MMHFLRLVAAVALAGVSTAQHTRHPLDPSQQDTVLQYMNNLRSQYGAGPLTWDAALQQEAYNHEQTVSCDRSISRLLEPGVFVFVKWDVGSTFDLPAALEYHIGSRAEDYEEQAMPVTSASYGTAAFSHTVWKSLHSVGCARCEGPTVDMKIAGIIKCVFDQAGNIDGEFAAEVGKKGDVYDRCAGVVCQAKVCRDTSCDPDTGLCLSPFVEGSCDDGNPHTTNDRCVDGECVGACPTCGSVGATVQTIAADGVTVLDDAPEVSPLADFMPAWVHGTQQMHLYGSLPPPPTRGFFPKQSAGIAAGSSIHVVCPCNAEERPCEVILVQYHCPACSADSNGGWPAVLPGLGWRPGSCAPKMTLASKQGDLVQGWKMLAFRQLVPPGQTVVVPVDTVPLEHAAVFVQQCAVDCAEVDPLVGHDECVCPVGAGACSTAWCPRKTQVGAMPVAPCEVAQGCAPSLLG